MQIEIDHFGDLEQLDHIDASAPALQRRQDGLRSAETLGEIALRQASRPPAFDEDLDEAQMTS